MTGNTLGERRYYKYTSDKDVNYSYLTDQDLGTAVSAELNDTFPPMPRRFKPRGVYAQATINGKLVKKFLVIGATTNTAWADKSTTITIDSQSFKTTGRRGESLTFGSNPTAAPPTS
jgi:hypothetical protein